MDEYTKQLVNDTICMWLTAFPDLLKGTAQLAASKTPKSEHLSAKIRANSERLLAAWELVAPLVDDWANSSIKDWALLIQSSRAQILDLLSSRILTKYTAGSSTTLPPRAPTFLHLPDDILWQIASHVRDQPTQCSMSLVSRAWHAAALPRLWTYISIRHPNYDTVCTRLFKLAITLRSNPQLGILIREFECQTRSPEDLDPDDEDPEVMEDEPTSKRLVHDFALSKMVRSLMTNVEALHIQIEPLHMYDGFFDVSAGRQKSLRHLDFGSSMIDDTAIQRIAQCCPNLEEIFLRDCEDITSAGFLLLVRSCRKIRRIGINGCEKIGDESVVALVERCQQLEAIALGYRQNLTDASISCLARKAKNIQALLLDGRDTLSEAPLLELLNNSGPNIRTLDISFCDITDRFVLQIAEKCHRLESLSLNGCKEELSDVGIRRIMETCSRLRVLALEDNEGLSEELLGDVFRRFGEDVPSITREFRYFRKWLR
ncbi:hypothetical protein HK097_008486 [Rhizophlyctis rosea]|uniref:F-box domain-containing protein n=1 Tax=Rhizophlyctis rosea TaxID=64517 RepID=A0AAD5SIW1_9FUNG|nr:hypothetical protein HK097_008486 [Rhizophlyctis rosea]